MSWTLETVGGHPCEVFRPAQRHPRGLAVVYLHGVHQAQLSDQDPYTEAFERQGLVVVGPRTRRSWWTDRICAEFDPEVSAERHVLDRVIPWIESAFGVAPPRIGLLGTSMGGQGALRFSYKHPTRFPVVAAISPAIDFHRRLLEPEEGDPLLEMYPDPESARQDTAILYIHPLNWPRYQFFCCDPADHRWHDSADRLRMKLSSLGVPFECELEATAGGHGFVYYNAMAERAVEFLVNGLNRVSQTGGERA
jgi:S-formylglutathione hydrolase FrmB